MMPAPEELLSRYFDEELSRDELLRLQAWLDNDPQNRVQFVELAMLHNQLHGQIAAQLALNEPPPASAVPLASAETSPVTVAAPGLMPPTHSQRYLVMIAVAAMLVLMFFLWRGNSTVEAGQAELQKVIAASLRSIDTVYAIHVEANIIDGAKQKRKSPLENRPPKPPLDGAQLIVRGTSQFVLQRTTVDGGSFITGSDGSISWMVPPNGPVRISRDLTRFHRDVPGHEFSMSLCNLPDALAQLKTAYDLHALPSEEADPSTGDATRLLVATKKRGYPGPRRVEITYLESSGEMEQLRFVDMPYGPDRLTVRLTLIDSQPSDNRVFRHTTYHAADRIIESE